MWMSHLTIGVCLDEVKRKLGLCWVRQLAAELRWHCRCKHVLHPTPIRSSGRGLESSALRHPRWFQASHCCKRCAPVGLNNHSNSACIAHKLWDIYVSYFHRVSCFTFSHSYRIHFQTNKNVPHHFVVPFFFLRECDARRKPSEVFRWSYIFC